MAELRPGPLRNLVEDPWSTVGGQGLLNIIERLSNGANTLAESGPVGIINRATGGGINRGMTSAVDYLNQALSPMASTGRDLLDAVPNPTGYDIPDEDELRKKIFSFRDGGTVTGAAAAAPEALEQPEEIIRGPGPDGVYRVGGNQRYENSRGSFSRSNQSIGERLQDEAKFDKEFGDTFQGLIGQLVHAGVIPDENQISGKPDANGRRSGGLRSLANEMAASSIPRKSRAAYSPTGGQIPEEPDNSGDDSTSNTQLALMGTLIAGLVDQMAFKGAGRKMLGNQLGKIPGLGKLASKGEAKAVEAATKANKLTGQGLSSVGKAGDLKEKFASGIFKQEANAPKDFGSLTTSLNKAKVKPPVESLKDKASRGQLKTKIATDRTKREAAKQRLKKLKTKPAK